MAARLILKIDWSVSARGFSITWFWMVVNAVVKFFDDLERLVHSPLQEAKEQVIGPVLHPVAGVALDGPAVLVQKRKGPGVVRDQEVSAEENVKLVQLQLIAGGIQRSSMKDEVNILSPVIDLGDVRFLECVLDGESMKPEGRAQEGFGLFHPIVVRVLQIHPERSVSIRDGLRDTSAWPVEVDGA